MLRKITVNLYGGLGNQLFQYFASSFLRSKMINLFPDIDVNIVVNTRILNSYKTKHESSIFAFHKDIECGFSILNYLRFPRIFSIDGLVNDKNYSQLQLENKNYYLDGYFQDCMKSKEFNDYLLDFKSEFSNLNKKKSYFYSDACVIHVRGGDFLRLGWSSMHDAEYYRNSILHMKKLGVQDFFLITDDADYARKLIDPVCTNFEIISSTFLNDFVSIGLFQYRILSSSTFSFWASALSSHPNPVVVAPEFWSPGRRRNLRLPGEVDL